EPNAAMSQGVDVRRLDPRPGFGVATDRLVGLVVGEDEEDVRLPAGVSSRRGDGRDCQHRNGGREVSHESRPDEKNGGRGPSGESRLSGRDWRCNEFRGEARNPVARKKKPRRLAPPGSTRHTYGS